MSRPLPPLWLLWLGPFLLAAVTGSAQSTLEEDLTEGLSEAAGEYITEQLSELRHHPLRINTASARRIRTLPFIYPMEAERLIQNRRLYGKFKNWEGLLHRAGLDALRWQRFTPYLTLGSPGSTATKRRIRLTLRRRLPSVRGLRTGKYRGDGCFLREKATLTGPLWRGALLLEKDAGEPRLADHISGHVERRFPAQRLRVVAGDYQLQTAQGWVFWSPYGAFLGADPVSPVLGRPRGLIAYAGASENRHLRGCAAEWQIHNWAVTLLASHVPFDAAIDSAGQATSWPESGYHRTETEAAKRNRATETLWGGRLHWGRGRLALGATAWQAQYAPQRATGDALRQHFQWAGRINHVAGLDLQYRGRGWLISAEAAQSRSGGLGANAVLLGEQKGIQGVIAVYRADADFHNPRSFVLGQAGIANQRGLYAGLGCRLAPGHSLSLHVDHSFHPWRSYTLPMSTSDHSYFLQWEARWVARLTMQCRYIEQRKERRRIIANALGDRESMTPFTRQRLRLELFWRSSPRRRLRGRVEHVHCIFPREPDASRNERGWLVFVEGSQRWRRVRLRLRGVGFHADGYESRVGHLAPTLPGNYGYQSYTGRGWGLIALAQLQPVSKLWIGLHAAWHRRSDAGSWGSGHDALPGKDKVDVTLQLDWRGP